VIDRIKRWMTAEGTFRILATRSTDAIAEAVRFAECSPAVADVYGRLLTGTSLLQLAQSPIDRVQCAVEHSGSAGTLLADVWPGPCMRGRIENAEATAAPVLGDDMLIRVTRQPARGGAQYESHVPATDGHIANALQQYVLESEQVLTLFALVTVQDDTGELLRAGGMIVQALPGATREHLAQITACLEKAPWDDLVRAGDDPIDAAEALFNEIRPHHVGDDPITYRCRCSRERAVNAVTLLSEEELKGLHAGGAETVVCEFCRTSYEVTAADLETH